MSFAPIFAGFGSGGVGGGLPESYFASDMITRPYYSGAVWPAAIYSANADKTYVAWISVSPPQTTKVMAYDHSTETWSAPVVVDTSLLQNDDHGQPALELLSDGRLVVFYGSHAGATGAEDQQWSISGESGGEPDITTWTRQTALSTSKYTYPKPVNISSGGGAGTLWLIYRKGEAFDGNMPLCIRSAAYTSGGGLTFGAETVLVDFDAGSGARVYASEVRLVSGNIEFMATRADLNDTERRHVFYFRYIVATGAVENLSGGTSTASGSLPIGNTLANSDYREFTNSSASHTTGFTSSCRDGAGNLHALFGDDDEATGGGDFDVYHMVHNGTSWSTPAIAFTTQRKGVNGFVENWCAVPKASGIEAWYPQGVSGGWTGIGGDRMMRRVYSGSWGSEATILTASGHALAFPSAVKDASSDLRVIFSEASQGVTGTSDRFFGKRYAYGDGGFIQFPTPTDPYIGQVVALLGFNGSNGATATSDESWWSDRHNVVFNGTAKLDTAQSKFGGSSLRLDGTGAHLTIAAARNSTDANGSEWKFHAGDTLEFFFRPNLLGTSQILVSDRNGAAADGFTLLFNASNKLQLVGWDSGGSLVINITGATSLTTGQWYYVALQRDVEDWSIHLDGVSDASATSSGPVNSGGTTLYIGRNPAGTNPLNGWIDELRWTKGVIRGVSVTPTAAFPRD